MKKLLFVCMGNICRSPSAEGFFRHLVTSHSLQDRFTTDSAGTHSYHLGYPPDSRAIETAWTYDIDISDLRARKVTEDDFSVFDLIIAMDQNNLSTLQRMQPAGSSARVALMMDWAPQAGYREVPDPYYGNMSDFKLMCELLEEATSALLEDLQNHSDH